MTCRLYYIFATLILKNLAKQKKAKLIFIAVVLLPLLSAFILVIFRYSKELFPTGYNSEVDDDSLNFRSSWNSLIDKINSRRERMLKAQKNFDANVFIPNIRVAYAPSSHVGLTKLMEGALGKLDITKNDMNRYSDCGTMRTLAPSEQFLASVCFHNKDVDKSKNGLPKVLHYSIIMPSELRIYEHTFLGQCWQQKPLPVGRQFSDDVAITQYFQEGFVALQYYISTEYIKMASGSGASRTPATILRRLNAVEAYTRFSGGAATVFILMMVLGFMFPVTLFVKLIVEEYETGQCFVLNVNNVGRYIQVAAWFASACCQMLVTTTLLTLILKINWNGKSAPLDPCPVFILILFFVSYSFAVSSFIIFMSAIISSTKLALVIVPIIWLLMQFPFFFKEELKVEITVALNVVACIFLCNVTLSWGLTYLLHIEDHPDYKADMNVLISSEEFSLGAFILFFWIQTLVFILLTLIIQSHTMERLVSFIKHVTLFQCLKRRRFEEIQANMELQEEISVVIEDSVPISSQYLGLHNIENPGQGQEKGGKDNRWLIGNIDLFKPRPNDSNATGTETQPQTQTQTQAETQNQTETKAHRNRWKLAWFDKKHFPPPQQDQISIDSDPEIETREAVIEFQHVWKKFGENIVIKGFTLKVFRGEVVVLLGHNSSGKTTIMKMICGLTLPTRGEIYLSGVNIVQQKRHLNLKAYRNVGISLSGKELFSAFTVFNHLMFFCSLRGLKRSEAAEEVKAYLSSMQMEDVQQTRVGSLSLGQKRILQSICAFAGRTEIVLLSKPLDGVDEARAMLFFNFVQAEKRKRTIFVTTNRSTVASGLGDRLAILSKGNLVYLGTERKMCRELNDAYQLTFYGKAQCDFGEVRKFLETFIVTGVKFAAKMGDSAIFLINREDVPQLTKALETLPSRKVELKIDSFHLQECSLDRIIINQFTPELPRFAHQAPKPFIVLRHRALIDIRSLFYLIVKVFLPTVTVLWMGLCMLYLHNYRPPLENSVFPVNKDSDRSAFTLAQRGLSINDGPLMAAYNKYLTMGARKVDANMDITNMQKILATAKFTENEVNAVFNNKLTNTDPLVKDDLASGYVGFDSDIKVELEALPYATLPALRAPHKRYNITLLFVCVICLTFCIIWTLPMLFITLDRDNRLNYLELIAGMGTKVLIAAIMVYELVVFVIAFMTFHLAVIILRYDSLMDIKALLLYGNSIMAVAVCVLSINILISLKSPNIHNAYLMTLAFHTLGLVAYLLEAELVLSGSRKLLCIFLDFYPLTLLMENLMAIFSRLDTKWICTDVQVFETSVYAEECKVHPNCCDNSKTEFYHLGYTICPYILTIFIWILIYAILRSQLYKVRPRRGKYYWDSDADSRYDQHILHIAKPSDVENTWIYEKSRVRTLERSLMWKKTVHVEDLSVLFGQRVALNKVDFMVDRYQILSLFGANGSGKTVLNMAIMSIYSPSSGRVSGVNRIPYQRDKPTIGNLAGYSPQDVRMTQGLTVLEACKLVLRLRIHLNGKELRQEAIFLCKMLNLDQYRYHFLSLLSQGVLKRLSIGLALMTNAELILLDDPFANLDVSTQHAVLQSIQGACRHGHCVIYTCSHTDFLAPAQRMAALGRRGFVAIGERQEITRNYYTSYFVIETRIHLPEQEQEQKTPGENNSSRKRRNYLKVSGLIEKKFPGAIIKSVNYPSTCFWLSSQKYPISQIFQTFERNKKNFYSYSIAQPSVGAIYLHITPEQKDDNVFGY